MRNRDEFYQAQITLPEQLNSMNVSVTRSSIFEIVDKLFGGDDVEVGFEVFDDIFIINSSDPVWFKSIIHDGLTKQHLALPNAEVCIQDGGLMLRQQTENYIKLEQLTRLSMVYLDAILDSPAPIQPDQAF